ncbi:MAG: hypothetical protein AB7F89_11275 [Pirellulaceae bacterium]
MRHLSRYVLTGTILVLGYVSPTSAADCGSERARPSSCGEYAVCRQCCCRSHRCCCERRQPEPLRAVPRYAEVPSGPIVESYPVMRAAPTMMVMPVMPMMMGVSVRGVSLEEPRSREYQPTCASSKDRLDELDDRVEALNLRLQTIQRAVELQTVLLEELRAQGAFGTKSAPANNK